MDIMILLTSSGVTRESVWNDRPMWVRSEVGEMASNKVSLATARFNTSILSTNNWLNLVHKLLFSFPVRTQALRLEDSNSSDIRQRCLQSAADSSSSWKNLKRDALTVDELVSSATRSAIRHLVGLLAGCRSMIMLFVVHYIRTKDPYIYFTVKLGWSSLLKYIVRGSHKFVWASKWQQIIVAITFCLRCYCLTHPSTTHWGTRLRCSFDIWPMSISRTHVVCL